MVENVDILVIGQSHTEALKAILRDSPIHGLKIINLNTLEDGYTSNGTLQRGVFHPSIVVGIRPRVVFSMMGGNFHTVFGLIEDPTPFDLFSPEGPKTAVDEVRQYIPYSLVYEHFRRRLNPSFLDTVSAIRDHFQVPTFQICSPPAFSDSEYIAENPGGYFRELISKGVAPPPLRQRLFLLHSNVVRKWCLAESINFIEPPQETLDSEGYLERKYWYRDPSHANRAYGKLVLDQILQIAGQP